MPGSRLRGKPKMNWVDDIRTSTELPVEQLIGRFRTDNNGCIVLYFIFLYCSALHCIVIVVVHLFSTTRMADPRNSLLH